MNPVDIHLALNHVPVIGVPIALVLLGWGLWRRSPDLTRAGLALLVATALVAVPVYLTGEPAEEVVEGIAGISHRAVHDHEDAAVLRLAHGVLTRR